MKPISMREVVLARWVFLRFLGAVNLIAFLSLWVQVDGLMGSRGILPARIPDAALHLLCGGGTALSALLVAGVAPAAVLLLITLAYLSLVDAGGDFLRFQWDALLLETDFLAVFFTPWHLWRRPSREAPPTALSWWLLRALLFKLMFSSGVTKLTWGDPTWLDGTALDHHYQTQPLPTWIGWWAHQLPPWFQKTSVGVMYLLEVVMPFLVFLPGPFRSAAGLSMGGLMVLILLTGNYCFFNLLTLALCVLCLDDRAWRWALRRPAPPPKTAAPAVPDPCLPARRPRGRTAKLVLTALWAIPWSLVSGVELLEIWKEPRLIEPLPRPLLSLQRSLGPFHLANGYGLFRVMTTQRNEIVIEGSNDGKEWLAYEFPWKPGDPARAPGFVQPHQPRLDWQMWFAALGSPHRNSWFRGLLAGLLEGSEPVLGLLERNPFPDRPPRMVRALLYRYTFTDPSARRAGAGWWRRELLGLYHPPVSLAGH